MRARLVVGKNFGDEGKGLATDYFAADSQARGNTCLVIRHNGGAQAGHTVDFPDKRFIFHQLSSGSFRNADTFWAQAFLPDLFKLEDEIRDFKRVRDRTPKIFAHPLCRCVCIDDVLVNMALETTRGNNRHGSCGMGINEAVVRSKDDQYRLNIKDACDLSGEGLYKRLLQLRHEYLPKRLEKLGLSIKHIGEYGDLLTDNNVLINVADQMKRASEMVVVAENDIVFKYDDVIFEGAQGLLLDENYRAFAPHLTSSKTGSDVPMCFIEENMPDVVPEIVYITRSYLTRHGAGPLPNEKLWDNYGISVQDLTNRPNEWQGSLRFAPHGTVVEFFADASADFKRHTSKRSISYMVTHLNETDEQILSASGRTPITQWFAHSPDKADITRLYLSSSPYSQDIRCLDL